MNIKGFQKGDGPKLTMQANRGDSFYPNEGEHVECDAPSITLGLGLRIYWTDETHTKCKGAKRKLLMRCSGCHKSWTLD